MARNPVMRRAAVVTAMAVVAVALAAGNADARRANVASAAGGLDGVSLWDRIADAGGRFRPSIQFGKGGWNTLRLRATAAQTSSLQLRGPLLIAPRVR